MRFPRLSGWQIVTLVTLCTAIIAIAAVALLLGKEAIIAAAVVLLALVLIYNWLLG